MKRINMRQFVLAVCSLISIVAVADVEVTVDGLVYSLSGTNATIVDYTSDVPADLVIPETVNYDGSQYEVSCIGNRQREDSSEAKTGAFYNCTQLQSIVIPSSVTLITSAENLSNSSDPENAPELDALVFYGCTNLKYVHFQGNTEIGCLAFYGCSNLETIKFDKSVDIMSGAFCKCTSLKYLVFPSGSTVSTDNYAMNHTAFQGCDLLQNVICLGDETISLNLDNVNFITRIDFVKWDNNSFVYSGNSPVLPSYTNNMPNGFTPTSSGNVDLLKDAGEHVAYIPFTFANDDMSFDVDIPYTYIINPVTLTAKVSDASRLYGDGEPDFSSTYTGFVNNEDVSVLTSNGSYTTTATIMSDVGTYAIMQTGATAQNYVFEYEDGTLTVNKAPLTMTANDKTMEYGGTIPTLDAKYEGLKNNESQPVWTTEPSLFTTATSVSMVGTYPITIGDGEAKNYQLTLNNGTLTIGKAELTVKADDKSRFYGDANPEFTLTYTGLKNGENVPEWEKQPFVETTADINSNAGTYPINIIDAVAVNYNITAEDGTLTIDKAALQITPNDATRKYGEDNPEFGLSYVGLKNNENVPEWTTEPIVSTNATKESPVGEYSIQVTSAEARNYTLEKNVGTLTITKAPLTVGVNNYSRKYGETNPTFELHYEGLLNNETAPQWTTMPTIATEATSLSDVGEYEITGTGGVMINYETEEIVSGVLTITQAPLILKANDISRFYYEENPELTFECIGLIGNDDASVLNVMPQIETSATRLSKVGIYAIEIDGASSKNYLIGYENGQLTINPRQLIVSTKDYTRSYGEENPQFELNYSGFVNNEDENVLLSKPKAMTEATAKSNVGTYDIVIDGGVAENYDFKYNGGKLTIEKASQTLTWDQEFNDVKQFDLIELTASASSGLEITYTIEGDPIGSITKVGDKQYLECTGVGEAVIVAIQEGNGNYMQSSKINKQIAIEMIPDNADLIRDEVLFKILSDNTVEVAGVSQNTSNLNIPESISFKGSTYHVTSIGKAAFHKNSTIESVELPNSITSIGKIAFGDCKNLKSINIPNSVTSIGDGAFYGCSSLTSLHIPDGIKRIGNNMFWGCVELTDVTIPNSVTIIDEEAFRECLTLGSITIPGNVAEIGKNAFQKCYKLTDVYCYAESVPNTDDTTFDGTPIESATLYVPANAVNAYIASWPWKNFGEIVAIGTTPDKDNPEKSGKTDFVVKGIGYDVLTDEIIVVSVDKDMTDVEIPDVVTFKGTDYYVSAIGRAAFRGNSTVETVVLPSSIESIGKIAFGDCKNLKSINIPNSVTSIGDGAFYGCSSLTSLHIPDGIKRIGNNMFWGCVELTDVTIPNSVTIIDEEAFRECLTLGSITIPGNVAEIGKNAFQKCYKLTDVYCYAEVLPITDNTVFDGTPIESATLHVPASVIDAYKVSRPWRGFKEIVALTDDDYAGIEIVKQSEDGNGEYFDLTGRKVSHPQKGIYIKNGKKVIVK